MVAGCGKSDVNGSAPSSSPASAQKPHTKTQQPVQQLGHPGQQSVLIGQYNLDQGQAEMKLVLRPITDVCWFALPTSPNDLVGEYLVACQGPKTIKNEYGFNPVKRVQGYPIYPLVGKINGNTYQGCLFQNNTAVGQFTLQMQ